jgi:hypothetical protein
MPDEPVDDAMRRACDALMRGDYLTPMAELTPEAMSEVMTIGAGLTNIQAPLSYTIDSHEEKGGEHRYRVSFTLPDRRVSATATWRRVDGAWKIAAIAVDAAG